MSESQIFKKKLDNGLTVLIMPRHHIPKVSMQLWYNVGSKYEKTGEKGMAHLIEHMIFKGTERLSESDISAMTTKLSGSCNAFTSYDFTGFTFDFPTQHWYFGLDILSDCMSHCTFKQELLNSELKTVIQELKMYKDNYERTLIEDLISNIFIGHPYSYPIIGYKADLCTLNSEKLKEFYGRHYVPNNATLAIVGDVDAQDAFKQVAQYFGSIPAGMVQEPTNSYLEKDFIARSVTLYRDVKQPFLACAFTAPGATYKVDYVLNVLNLLIGSGRGSRLYKKLVEEQNLATDVSSFNFELFEHSVFMIRIQPKDESKIVEIVTAIKLELQSMIEGGVSDREFERAQAQAKNEYISLFESNHDLAGVLGSSYLATHDENYILHYQDIEGAELKKAIKSLIETCLRPESMHIGTVLPLQEKDRDYWKSLQSRSDQEDVNVLKGKNRSVEIEKGLFVDSIKPKEFTSFSFPKYETFFLSNGLEVLYHHDARIPKIEAVLEFRANHLYDPADKLGLNNFVSQVLLKGTEKHSAIELADIIERKGMGVSSSPGCILLSMLKDDCAEGFDILTEILTQSVFKNEAIEQVRHKIFTDIADYWDQPYQFINHLVCAQVYAGHPYSKHILGTLDSIKSISRDDLLTFYKNFISPKNARLALVGDFSHLDIKKVLEETVGSWQGPEVDEITYPTLNSIEKKDFAYNINRDQVVLSFAGLSVDRKHADYDKLLLFDQIFAGGVLNSMSSRLFQVREQTGLFYDIRGSLLANSGKQPGVAFVKTLVSLDRLKEAQDNIGKVINEAADTLTDQELLQAKHALVNSMVNNFESYHQIALTFLSMRRYDLPIDYFDKRAAELMKYDVASVQEAAKKILNTEKMLTFHVGRV